MYQRPNDAGRPISPPLSGRLSGSCIWIGFQLDVPHLVCGERRLDDDVELMNVTKNSASSC